MIRFVHRHLDNSITSAHEEKQTGYAEEMLDTVTSPELVAFLVSPPPVDYSNLDNIEKSIRALAIVIALWNNKTIPQLKAAYRTARQSLL